jgi:hypothetical protein
VGKQLVDGNRALMGAIEALGADPNTTVRVVVDIQAGQPPIVYIEQIGDERVIDIVQALNGVEIERK